MPSISQFLTLNRLQEILARFADLRIGVIGDMGLDAYWSVDMTRSHLSRETPHFPRPVVAERYAPGAGANVAQNLAAAGVGQVSVFTVVGADPWAGLLYGELKRLGIETGGMFSAPGRRTVTYIKPLLMGYASQQEDARLDFENTLPLPAAAEDDLLRQLQLALPQLDAVIVADQLEEYGVITERVRAWLNDLALRDPAKIFLVDSRARIGLYRGMWLKPNALEAAAAIQAGGAALETDPDGLAAIGRALSRGSGRPAFITLSENGVLVCDEASGSATAIPTAPVRPPLDVVGAGDTFMAALAAGLAAGATLTEAAALANLAAAVTVEKLNQTGTATPAEILDRLQHT
jgi:rfaE bifunctional protein kinase chain/domain